MTIERSTELKPKPADRDALGFGQLFTDHMLLVRLCVIWCRLCVVLTMEIGDGVAGKLRRKQGWMG